MFTTRCPSCGAEVVFRVPGSVFAVCDFCQSTLVRNDVNVETLGKVSAINDSWTPLQRGTEGWYRSVHFALVGRVKLKWDRGTWNEWHAWFDDGGSGWISEAQGHYCISFKCATDQMANIPQAEKLTPGFSVTFDDELFVVADIKHAECVFSEGELPYKAMQGRQSTHVDLSSSRMGFACLEYSEEGVLLFRGEYLSFEALKFSNVREIDGW